MKIIKWEDIECIARINKEDNSLSFEVFEIVGGNENGDFYIKKGGKSIDDITSNLDDAETLIKGLIKWDACSHVTFGDENGYIHLCGGYSWFNFMEAVRRIWDIAIKELPQEHSKDMFNLELFTKSVDKVL